MAGRLFSKSKFRFFASSLLRNVSPSTLQESSLLLKPRAQFLEQCPAEGVPWARRFHDGRPRGPLWRGKKLIGKEALFAISGLKRFKDDGEKLEKFIKTHVSRLLKLDMIAVLSELERQEEVSLAVKMFGVIQKQDWYKPDVFLYKDLIIALARCKKMDEAMQLWETMRKEELFPDSQTYTEVIRGFLRDIWCSLRCEHNVSGDVQLATAGPLIRNASLMA
ncbi:hypothetical protein NL676_032794 [Syzygium grande]|nr:hypothetical protein NL676_032794 [Syzygium grande]